MKSKEEPDKISQNVPWEHFVRFIRQLSHDLRNQLNAAELESALIGELTDDAELKTEVRRLREMVSQLGVSLQSLSALVVEPRPTVLPYTAQDFIADIQKRLGMNSRKKSQRSNGIYRQRMGP